MNGVDRWLQQGWLRAVDHALAATLARLRPDTPEAVVLAAALASRALDVGHSGIRLTDLATLLAEIDEERPAPPLPDLDEWRAQLAASALVGDGQDDARAKPLVFERDRIALRRYWDYERRLAAGLRCLATPVDPPPVARDLQVRLAVLFPPREELDRQALAAFVAQYSRLLLLTGGPGTGKTTTVARLLALRVEGAQRRGVPLRVALAAPTGKAAARLAEALRENLARLQEAGGIDAATAAALPSVASTLHRLLGWKPNSTTFAHDAAHPLAVDLVVVDEASMVDLPLMCKLVEAIPAGGALILIGDRDQLPSVETGDVLAALCDAAGDGIALPPELARVASVALGVDVPAHAHEASAPALLRVELARTYRQSASLDLAPLAACIRDGDVVRALEGLHAGAFRGLDWRQGGDAELGPATTDLALPYYRAIAAAPDVTAALQMARRFRVLTAVREGSAGSIELNARIANALRAAAVRDSAYFRGRLVMVRENNYRHGLYNGDVGICWSDEHGNDARVWFETDNGLRSWLPAGMPRHDDAFVLTVHKAQGSEFDHVLFALPERGSRVLSRELLYTGLTRARDALTFWGSEPVVAAAIARSAQRWSGLADRLRDS